MNDNNLFIGMGRGLNFPEAMRRLEYWTEEALSAVPNEIRLRAALSNIKLLHNLLKTRRLVTSPYEDTALSPPSVAIP